MTPSDFSVSLVLNSKLGKRGAIGQRGLHVARHLRDCGIPTHCIARGTADRSFPVDNALPGGSVIPNMLNGIRYFVSPRFNNRMVEVPLFDTFAGRRLNRHLERASRQGTRTVVHLWEPSDSIVRACHGHGSPVILDIPIAPSHESVRLQQAGHHMDVEVKEVSAREDAALRLADLLIAPSEYVASILADIGIERERIIVNPFGVAPAARPAKPRDVTRGLRFIFVGTLSLRKGVQHLLEAWRSGPFKDDELILCGRPMKSIRNLVTSAGAPNVKMLGHISIQDPLSSSDVFVFPSLMEGSAKAVYEAMAAGLPTIATSSSGSVITTGTDGIIIPPADVDALESAMTKLKYDPELRARLGNAARTTASHYTWERYASGVSAAYERSMDLRE